MRRRSFVFVGIAAAIATTAAGTTTAAPPPFETVGQALEAQGIVACDAEWSVKQDELDGPLYFREERNRRIRLVVVDRPCPAPDDTGLGPDDEVDGSIRIVIYKSSKLRQSGSEHYRLGIDELGYFYGKRTLVVLDPIASPELQSPFRSTMSDLGAKRAFGMPSEQEDTSARSEQAVRFKGVHASNYSVGYDICSVFTPDELAADLGVTSTDPTALAEAYAEDYRESFRQAPFEGCLDALLGNARRQPEP